MFMKYNISAMIDSRMGESQVNSFMTILGVSPVSSNIINHYKDIVGMELEKLAMETCDENLRLEKELDAKSK